MGMLVTGAHSAINAYEAIRNNSDDYRYAIGLLHKHVFDFVEWGLNKPDFFKVAKNYTGSTEDIFQRLENCAKLLSFSPVVKIFNGSYAGKTPFFKLGCGVVLASDLKTGVDFLSGYGVNFSRATELLNKVSFYGITPQAAFLAVVSRTSLLVNGLFAADAFDRWEKYIALEKALHTNNPDRQQHFAAQIDEFHNKAQSAKWEAISYTADFALASFVAKGEKSVPVLGAMSVACLGFKVYSAVLKQSLPNIARDPAQDPTRDLLGDCLSKIYKWVQISEGGWDGMSSWDAKEKLMKLTHKVALLAAAYNGSVSDAWVSLAEQAQNAEKLMENVVIGGAAKKTLDLGKSGYACLSAKNIVSTVGTVALFTLKSLTVLAFGDSLGFYKLDLLKHQIGTIPTFKVLTGVVASIMTSMQALDAFNKSAEGLELYTKIAKFAVVLFGTRLTVQGNVSKELALGMVAAGAVVDAMGYAVALKKVD